MSGIDPEKMSLDSQSTIKKMGNSYILYDAGMITEPTVRLFDADYHTKADSRQNNSAVDDAPGIGRAKVVYFSSDDRDFVLKHYYRGGAVAAISKDTYLGFSVVKSRAFREWRLLKKMSALGLPVPVAVAAHIKKGLLSYRADLITEKIAHTKTLADKMCEQKLSAQLWQSIGVCIRSFHDNNVYHADLNARNILIDEQGDVYLIDFDNSGFRSGSGAWKMANLARLKRSLLKFKRSDAGFSFDEADWSALLAGYKNGVAE